MAENYIEAFHTWATGETITASRLNGNVSNLVDGLNGGVKAINVGKVLIGSVEIVNSSREVSNLTKFGVDNLELNGNTISSTDANGDINITPNGTGTIKTVGSIDLALVSKSSAYTVAQETIVLVDDSGGDVTITLPATGNSGRIYTIFRTSTGSNTTTIDPDSTETINGGNNAYLYAQNTYVMLVDDGSNWKILSKNTKIFLQIGDWNMDADNRKTVAHGLSTAGYKAINKIQATIRDDADTINYPLNKFNYSTGLVEGGVLQIDAADINLDRRSGGDFDSTSYDSTSFNRGWIVCELAIDR